MTRAPFGSWPSPITTDLIVADSINLKELQLTGTDVHWLEQRPRESGRTVLVRNGVDVTRAEFSVRSRVHEYGGGSYTFPYFVNDKDQQIYSGTTPITNTPGLRFADLVIDRDRLIAVCEDHRAGGEPVNSLVAIADRIETLAAGNDFYSSPCVCGNHLAYLTWNHPNMPWDETELWLDGQKIADGASIFQPQWSPDGVLHFVSDRNNWWNIYRYRNGQIEHVLDLPVEFGMAQWNFGMSTYAFLDDGRIACAFNDRGTWRLGLFDGTLRLFDLPYTEISQVRAAGHHVVFLGSAPEQPSAVIRLNANTGHTEILRRSTTMTIDPRYISPAVAIDHAFYYPPTNPDFEGLPGELPPLIVMCHGGPTSATTSGFNLQKQFWTSRGFAVVDVNYGGSTGFGRDYRQRLNGQWGIVDVDDCCAAARQLVDQKLADPNRLIIRGGSAGGFTTLAALTFRQVFKAGASYYGISDLEASNDTHKFESRYNYRLIAPWPAGAGIYHSRSPLRHCDRLNCPVIFFQGLDDKVVLPNQSTLMVDAMQKKGLLVEYLEFPGEGHGFRQAATVKQTLEAELAFYRRVFAIRE
ncbi:MAG: S9 family peptidase [Verrucomicrobiota bacterium]